MLPNAMARKPMVMALDTPVTDQPVSRAIGCKQNGQREHRSDRDAAQKAARRDDHPSVARFGHHAPYQLVGFEVKRPTAARLFGPAEQSATSITSS